MDTTNGVNAVAPVNNGMSLPYRITCDDGYEYHVKFKDNPNGTKFLVNEFISSEIANILNIPVPINKIINLDESFINLFGNKIAGHIKAIPSIGLHFGSRSIEKSTIINSSKVIAKTTNNDVLSSVLLFDHLIGNIDRTDNIGNLLLDIKNKEIVVIDHTHAFELASVWDEAQLNRMANEDFHAYNMHECVYSKWIKFINGNNPFQDFFDNLRNLTDDCLESIINEIPQEWGVTEGEQNALIRYLKSRRDKIHTLPLLLKPYLPYWKGGNN